MPRANPERVKRRDRFMIGLALVNILLLFAYQSFQALLPPFVLRYVLAVDGALVVIYAIEFIAGVSRAPAKKAWVASHWYDLVGLLPLGDPIVRSLRMLRIVRVRIFSDPANLASDKSFGELALEGFLQRTATVFTAVLIKPLILTGLFVAKPIVTRMRFAEILGTSIEATNEQVRELVRENLKQAPGIGKVFGIKQVDHALKAAEDAAVHAVVHTLQSEQLNRLLQETSGNVIDAMTEGVKTS